MQLLPNSKQLVFGLYQFTEFAKTEITARSLRRFKGLGRIAKGINFQAISNRNITRYNFFEIIKSNIRIK